MKEALLCPQLQVSVLPSWLFSATYLSNKFILIFLRLIQVCFYLATIQLNLLQHIIAGISLAMKNVESETYGRTILRKSSKQLGTSLLNTTMLPWQVHRKDIFFLIIYSDFN